MNDRFSLILCSALLFAFAHAGFAAVNPDCLEATKQLLPSPLNVSFLPPEIPIQISRPESADYYRLAREAWDRQYDPAFLKMALGRLAAGDTSFLNKENKKRLKAIRKASDVLRTAFLILDESHEGPKKLHQFVADFGDLDDTIDTAMKRGFNDKINDRIASRARALQKELDGIDFSKQLGKFHPAGKKTIRKELERLVSKTRSLMSFSSLSNDEFHTIRKAVRKLGKVFALMAQRSSSTETQKVADYLLELSHVLGKIHATAVSDAITGVTSYDETRVTIPSELRVFLQSFFDRLEIR